MNADDTDVLGSSKGNPINANLFIYCLNNPVNHSDPNGCWVLDAIFLAADIADMAMHPSAEGAAFILLDCVCFVDPSGAADAGIHAVKVGIEAIKVAKAIDKGKDVISAAKDAYKVADKIGDIKKATGSYEILYESGKNYVGKGGFNRAITSAKKARKVEGEVDEVVSISWKKSANSRQAFIDELDRMKVNGVNNPSTYNKIWSPGRRYTGAVEW